MFTEYLQNHPAEKLLREEGRRLYPPLSDREAWDAAAEAWLPEIRELAEKYRGIPWPARTAGGFLEFSRGGSRQADEKPYFTRRRKLCAALLEQCAFPGADPGDLIDGVWMICEETSWVISAHNVNPIPGAPAPKEYPLPDPEKPYVDLFSAQTGMILALCGALAGEKLDEASPVIRRRIRDEIRRRILTPFMETDDFWWMGFKRKDLNNWTPWILSNILVCACLDPMPGKELAGVLERACGMLDRYLDVLPEDGGCDEGAGYWNMAGGALLDCLCLMERITGGAMSFREDQKIRNIMAFPRKAELGGGWFVNFADCDARPFISGERMERAGEMFGDPGLAALGTRMRGTIEDQLQDVPHLTRALDLIFHPPLISGEEREQAPKDEYLPDLQVRILEKGRWTLACKGGHNAESHNHNDAGSFILFGDGEPVIVDAGNMVYTAKTFSEERYTLWNVRGAYHNLPMFGSAEEKEGPEHRAREVRCTPEGMEMDLAAAYGEGAGVRSFRRSLRLTREGLAVTDAGELEAEKEITWIFMLREQPCIGHGKAAAGRFVLEYPEDCDAEAEEIRVEDTRMARNWPGSLWRLKIRCPKAKTFRGEFTLRAAAPEEKGKHGA